MTDRFPTGDDDRTKNGGDADLSDRKIQRDPKETSLAGETAKFAAPNTQGDLATHDDLPDDLTPAEQAQAKQALAFLDEVRNDFQAEHSFRIPERIGRYTIVRSIGRGGFAEVFLAEDEELDRRVALKVPRFDSLRNEAACHRFEREAKLAASLGHPQIVPVFEYGDLGPIRFIAFAWCDGPNLSQWINENGKVDNTTAAQIVKHLSEAVQHAHQRGIVHRDLKPSNVLVDASPEVTGLSVWQRLRITDFGLARNFESLDATLTQDGQLVGTPAYMSPEQARGESEIRATSDIYALGVILYELVTGKVPFKETGHLATIRAVEQETPTPPRKIDPTIPKDLDAICQKCLCKSPSDRYATAFELGEELDAFLGNRPVKVRPPGTFIRLKRWALNNQKLATTIGFAITSLIVGLGLSLWQWNVANNESVRANREADRATQEADRASSHLSSLYKAIDLMLKDINVGSQAEIPESQKQLLTEIIKLQKSIATDRDAEKFIPLQLAATARAARIHVYLGQYKECEEIVQECLPLIADLDFEDIEPENMKEIWGSVERIFRSYIWSKRRMNNLDESILAIDELSRIADLAAPFRAPLKSASLKIYLLEQKGNANFRAGKLEESVAYLKEACEFARDCVDSLPDPKDADSFSLQMSSVYINRARSEHWMGFNEDAFDSALVSTELTKKHLEKNPDDFKAKKGLALSYINSSTYDPNPGARAKELLALGVKQFESLVEQHPSENYSRELLAYAYSSTASLMFSMRKSAPKEAISAEEALATLEKVNGLVDFGLLDSADGRHRYLVALDLKVDLLLELGRTQLAHATALESVELTSKFDLQNARLERDRNQVLRAMEDLAKCEIALDNAEDAVVTTAEIRKLVATEQKITSPDSHYKGKREELLLWALKEEALKLTALERFNEAVDRIRSRMEIVYVAGQKNGQRRYYSGAYQIAQILAAWRESDAFPSDSFNAAETEALAWLQLAYENKHFTKSHILDYDVWDPLRDDDKFAALVEQVKNGNP